MKCLIFSDSHGNWEAMSKAIENHRDAEAVFFLGDGLRDAEFVSIHDKERTWFYVAGNCDFRATVKGENIKKTDEVTLFGKKIVYTHGDIYGVKLGNSGLCELAEARCADIVLYGHTHTAREDYLSINERGVYFFNPGSLEARWNFSSSYGIFNIDEKNILFSIARI